MSDRPPAEPGAESAAEVAMEGDGSRSEGGRRIGAAAVFGLALAVRLAVVAWAAERIPPVADGTFYHTIATRISQGLGYTWLWPDGVVTNAGHYPVGYPALVGAMYAIAGPRPGAAMILNAALGALAAAAAYRLVEGAGGRRSAAAAGTLVALHPGLVSYTPALMTEGVTAALIACAAWAVAWSRGDGRSPAPRAGAGRSMEHSSYSKSAPGPRGAGVRVWIGPVLTGLILGVATLVRPQSLLLAPVFGWLAARAAAGPRHPRGAIAERRAPAADLAPGVEAARSSAGGSGSAEWRRGIARKLAAAGLALAAALAVCAPWTARNCARMGRCALVSYNGGWNLLIGADEASTGTWAEIKVPPSCREVFDEAGKDACFGEAARRYIAEHPAAWLALAPKKLAATFDYAGAGAWYLHTASAAAFPDRAKVALGAVETVFERLALLVALLVAAWPAVRAARARLGKTPTGRAEDAARAPAGGHDEDGARAPASGRDEDGARAPASGRDEDGARAPAAGRSLPARAIVTVLLLLPAVASVFWLHVWIGYLLLPLVLLTAPHDEKLAAGRPREDAARRPALISTTSAVLASLCVTHAVFFGAGRYSLVAFPFVTAVAALALARRPGAVTTSSAA